MYEYKADGDRDHNGGDEYDGGDVYDVDYGRCASTRPPPSPCPAPAPGSNTHHQLKAFSFLAFFKHSPNQLKSKL